MFVLDELLRAAKVRPGRTTGTILLPSLTAMPRRTVADPLNSRIGARIRQLRKEQGLTAEKLAYASEIGSKGYVSDIEAGLASPSISTLAKIANHLGVELVDLFTFPKESPRHELMDKARFCSKADLKRELANLEIAAQANAERRK